MHSFSESELEVLTHQVASTLIESNQLLAVAESCTGGWLAKCCTDLAGSSAWFDRGYVTYSNQSKQEALGIDPNIISNHGAVSKHTAIAMALGVIHHSHASLSVAITGIAGPDGGTSDKPVGTVWIAWAKSDLSVEVTCHLFKGNRKHVRMQAVMAALKGILKNARD
jgi:nicotinamide-nucleotide amidase